LAKQHFNIFDPLFLARGKLARLLDLGNSHVEWTQKAVPLYLASFTMTICDTQS
jgi:hypothetical protein